MNHQWTEVRSGRLLRRLVSKGLIEEPPEEQRPAKPSERVWGKGYHYIQPIDGRPMEWDFEGSHYRIIQREQKFYVWKTSHRNAGKSGR